MRPLAGSNATATMNVAIDRQRQVAIGARAEHTADTDDDTDVDRGHEPGERAVDEGAGDEGVDGEQPVAEDAGEQRQRHDRHRELEHPIQRERHGSGSRGLRTRLASAFCTPRNTANTPMSKATVSASTSRRDSWRCVAVAGCR